jgi:hypothetical protein
MLAGDGTKISTSLLSVSIRLLEARKQSQSKSSSFDPVCGQHGLDLVPERLIDNRQVFSGINIAFVGYLAAVKPILEDEIECPARERLAPIFGRRAAPAACF